MEDAPQLRSNFARRSDIQGLRALAVVLVVAFHAGLAVPGGFIGVDVFFVISGFVITGILVTERWTTGRISFGAFYSRRARRILPPLALTVFVTSVLAFVAVSPLKPKATTARTGLAAMFSLANVYLFQKRTGYFGADQATNALLHTWSLSVEEQFYLVFPALVVLTWWLGRRFAPERSRRLTGAVVIGMVAAGSFVLCLATTPRIPQSTVGDVGSFAFYMAPARAWEFSAGALLAFAIPRLGQLSPRTTTTAGWVGALVLGYGAFEFSSQTRFPGVAALVPVVGTGLIIAAGVARGSGVNRLLSLRPVTRIGDVSYSWYLWHWPVIVFAQAIWPASGSAALIAGAVSLVPAWLAYRFVENPIRLNSRIVGRRALALALSCVMAAALSCIVLDRVQLPGRSTETAALLAALTQGHGRAQCNQGRPLTDDPGPCTWRVPNSKGTIVLVGDSNAGQFTEPAVAAAAREGYDLLVATRNGCAFAAVLVVRGDPDRDCLSYVERSVRALTRRAPALVLMASSTPSLVNASNIAFQDPVTGHVTRSRGAKEKLWTAGLRRVLRPLSNAGVPTAVIHTIPQFLAWRRDCAAIRAYLDPASCGTSLRRSVSDNYRRPARRAEAAAVRNIPGTFTVDFADRICTPSVCRTNRGGRWLYFDINHLSRAGSLELTDPFARLIATHAVRH